MTETVQPHHSTPTQGRPAIFLDRDGTLNVDHGYVSDIDHFQFIDGAIEALRLLKQRGFLLVLVTNQSGIARGYFSEDDFLQLTEWMDWSLADRGVDLDGIYYCPHHPQATVDAWRQTCNCRKPQPGMLLEAQQALGIDMARSVMVGDRLADIDAGWAAGVGTTVLVRTGKPLDEATIASASYVIDSLAELPTLLQKNARSAP